MNGMMLGEFALRFTQALTHFLWIGVVLALVVCAWDRLLVRTAAGRHALHLAGVLLLVLALPVCYFMAGGSGPEVPAVPPAGVVEGGGEPAFVTAVPAETGFEEGIPTSPAASAEPVATPVPEVAAVEEIEVASGTPWLERCAPWVVAIYLAGLLAMTVRLLAGLAGTRCLRQGCDPVRSGIWLAGMQRMCATLEVKTKPLLAWSREVAAPVLIGLAKPVVLLPVALASRLTPDQLEAVLAHELAHLRRLDPWAVALQRVVETVLFFHPAVWWMSRRLDASREEACDDLVVAAGCDPADYAEALVRCSEVRLEDAGLSGRLATRLSATGRGGASLRHRVLRLLGQSDRTPIRPGRAGWILGAVALAGVVLAAATGSAVRDDLADFDFDDPPGGYEKGVRVADRNHAIKVGGLRFRLSKLEENGEGFLQADLGVAKGFEVEEFRLFDHETRELLHDSHWQRPGQRQQKFFIERVGATEHIRFKEAGGHFPDKIDVWMRVDENGSGPVIHLPAQSGGTGRSGKSEIVIKTLLRGTMNGRGEQHLPGKEMLWDLSTVHGADSSLTLNIENRGEVLKGRHYLVAVKKDGSRHPHDKYFQFSPGRQFNYARLDVAVEDVDHFELLPFKDKHKFFFNGVAVPGMELPELSANQRRQVERLVKRAGSRDESERDTVVESLVAIGPGVAPEMIPLLKTGKTDVVGLRVLQGLAPDPAVQRLLVKAVDEARNNHPNVVHCGLFALRKSKNRDHVDFVAGFLKSNDMMATSVLAELGGDLARKHLIRAFEVVPTEHWWHLAESLEQLGDPAALPELRKRLGQVELPPNEQFPGRTVWSFTNAIAALSGKKGRSNLMSYVQGQRFRFPYSGPGTPKTFSVDPPSEHYAKLPEADPNSAAGRSAIWRALEDATEGPGFTIDGDEVVLFHGLKAAPLWEDGPPYPTTLLDWLEETPHQLLRKLVAQKGQTERCPIPQGGWLIALDPTGRLHALSLKRESEQFTYTVGILPQDPNLQLIPAGADWNALRFTRMSGCTLHDLESGKKNGCLNLSRGHLDTLTEERWRRERRDALLTVEFASGGMAVAVGGAREFLLVDAKSAAGDPQKVVQLLRTAAGTASKDGPGIVRDEGGIFHVLPEGAKGLTYAFAVAMPDGLPVAGLIEIGEADRKGETLRIKNRFLPTATARQVFAGEGTPIMQDGNDLSVIDTSGNPIAGARVQFARHLLVKGKRVVIGEAVSGTDGRVAIPDEAFRDPKIQQLAVQVEAAGYVSRGSSHEHHMTRNSKGEWFTGVHHGVWSRSVVLLKGGTIAGRVLGVDGKPLAGAPLSITTDCDYEDYWRGSGPSPNNHGYFVGNHLRAISDENGEFRFEGVPAGELLLYYPWEGPIQGELDSGRWKQWTPPGQKYPQPPVADRAWGQSIRLSEGEQRGDIVVDLSKSTARIDGQVVDGAGQPVAGAVVRAVSKLEYGATLSWPDSFEGGRATTHGDGRFTLRGLPPGTTAVVVRHPRLESPQERAELDLRAGETARCRVVMKGALPAEEKRGPDEAGETMEEEAPAGLEEGNASSPAGGGKPSSPAAGEGANEVDGGEEGAATEEPALPTMVAVTSPELGLTFDRPAAWVAEHIPRPGKGPGKEMGVDFIQPDSEVEEGDLTQASLRLAGVDPGTPMSVDVTSPPDPKAIASRILQIDGVPARLTAFRIGEGNVARLMVQFAKGTWSYDLLMVYPRKRHDEYLQLALAVCESIRFHDPAAAGTIRGVLLGRDGEPVAGATVALCDAATGLPVDRKAFKPLFEGKPDLEGLAIAVTDDAGRFRFDEIPRGTYRLIAQSWADQRDVTKVFEKNGGEIILHGVAEGVRVPSGEAEKLVIRPLGNAVVSLDEDFPNSDALLVVSRNPLFADPVLGFISWQGPFLRGMLGANRMPKGFTRIRGLPEGEMHLSVFANDNNGGIGAGSVIARDGETVKADPIPIVCGWSNGRHDPPAELMPTFREIRKMATESGGSAQGPLDGLLKAEGIEVDSTPGMRAYFPHLDQPVVLPSGRKVRFADVLASALYLDLQRRVDLHTAVRDGEDATVATLLERGVNPNKRNLRNATPLHEAALHGHLPVVKLLVEHGADVNRRGDTYQKPLHFAAQAGHPAIVSYLLEHGAEVSRVLHETAYKGRVEIARLLLKHGADLNEKGSDEVTPLECAVANGQAELAEFLLARGADVNAQGLYGRTALHVAASRNDVAIGRILLKHGADPALKCNGRAVRPRSEEFRKLLEQKTGVRDLPDEPRAGIECTPSDPVNFGRAMGNMTTTPNYILLDAVDRSTGESWSVCLESLEFLDAVGRERKIEFPQVAEGALESIKDGKGCKFVLTSPAAVELLKPGYTPETLVQLRERFRRHSDEELVELFSANRLKILGSLCRELELPLDGTTQRAVAHMLLERGVLCGRGCLGGYLYVVPDLPKGPEQEQKEPPQPRPDPGKPGAIAGVLLGHDGKPVAQATVVLCDAETGIPVSDKTFKPFLEGKPDLEGLAAVTSDAGGRFRFGDVPAGPYRLVAQSWPEAPGVTKVFEKNGVEIILRGVADGIRVPSKEAVAVVIKPLGTAAVHLDEDFPNSDALLVVSTKPLRADPVLGFVSWQGPFLRNLIGANRMPKGVTKIGGLPAGEIHLSVFANDNNGGIGAGSVVAEPGELVQAEYIPIVCGWSNGRHDPPPELAPTFTEVKAIAARQNHHATPILDGLLAEKGVVVDRAVDAGNQMSPYYAHLDLLVSLPSGREVRFAEVLACACYLDLQRRVAKRRKKEGW